MLTKKARETLIETAAARMLENATIDELREYFREDCAYNLSNMSDAELLESVDDDLVCESCFNDTTINCHDCEQYQEMKK